MPITRHKDQQSVAVTDDIATTPEIPFGEFAGGSVHVPDGSGITTLTWHSAPNPGGTYEPAYDSAGDAVAQTVAQNQAHPIPVALYGAGAIKAVGNTSGTIEVSLKG